ncbi:MULTISPECIES: DUF5924 family protein [Pseudomonadaceae]|uniref:DUF5924 family protein n=1 Tax=Pseudomonadaceae TaxID=135621 RepID=UPI000F7A62BB|nr:MULTISPECIES: DUF5924 family protein [Pseudomonadaceae]MBE7928959.1 DUF2914 domain-containing protein [Pseudomonas saudiphocaensis]MCF6782374.1 DUF2914 domain-containing protein [Stutzerimonas stutzeri]MCF6805304.1 DUF2914 domain-containing protein [Stutzerimonas stutzeri]RRV14791.1 DUF2914 domain-containing protein [Pseudomonas saudiphocaensis]
MPLKSWFTAGFKWGSQLISRYPGSIALFGFCSGIASFVLVERQAGLAKFIAALMLFSWLWLMLENSLRRTLERRFGWKVPPPLLRYVTQMVHQESLFFIIPFFFVTTTWNSGQSVFTVILGLAALISLVDPLYYKWLAPRRWFYLAFHALTLFAVLLTALPIIFHLSTPQSYLWALGTAVLLALPSLRGLFPEWNWKSLLAIPLLTLVVAMGGWLGRTWVPPATLWMTDVAVTQSLDNASRKPGNRLKRVSQAELHAEGLFAFTAINAPRGLKERIYHEWVHNGRRVDRIPLDINGGRKAGYRAWTHKRNFPADAAGKWRVQVMTEAGQMIGMLRFEVTQ